MNVSANTPRTPRIVVVDDDATQLTILERLLRAEGYEALPFRDAEQALVQLDPGHKPDLIITDLYMPGLDGWSFCRLLRSPEYAAFNDTPLLIVSATFSGDEAANLAAALGAGAFLPMPVEPRRFLATVQTLLAEEEYHHIPQVLVVEDDRAIGKLLKGCFDSHGYQAEVADSGADAVEKFAQIQPEVVILDYHLSDVCGDALLVELRPANPDAVFIMMTGDPSPQLALEWMKKGAAAYVRKPFDPKYLLRLCDNSRRERALLRVEHLLEQKTQQLRESKERYRIVADFAYDWEYWLAPDQSLMYVSPSCERITGYTRDEFLQNPGLLLDIVHPEDREQVLALFNDETDSEVAPHEVDFRIVTRSGDVRWLSHVCRRVHGSDGQYLGRRGSNRDITERKAAEAALLDSRTRIAFLANNVSDVLWVMDPQADRFTYVSPSVELLRGYTVKEALGESLGNVMTPDSFAAIYPRIAERTDQYLAGAVGSHSYVDEIELTCKGGSTVWTETTTRFILNNRSELNILGISRNITEQKKAAKALKAELSRSQKQQRVVAAIAASPTMMTGGVEELARQLTELASKAADVERVGVWLFNEARMALECVDLYEATPARHSSGATLHVHEYQNEYDELLTAKYVDADDPLTDPRTAGYVEDYIKPLRITSMLDAVIRSGGHILGTLCFEHVDRPHHWEPDEISFACALADQMALVILSRDRNRAQAAVRESENHFRGLVEQSADFIWRIAPSGRFTFLSPAVRFLIGCEPEELIGQSTDRVLDENSGREFRRILDRLRQGEWGLAPLVVELRHRRRDGSTFNGEVRFGPLRDDTGAILAIQGITRDITEREHLQAQLLQSQKMEAIGQLAGGVAHDFNNLLQVILGHLENVRSTVEPNSATNLELKEAEDAAERAADLTRQLLAFGRRQLIHPANLDLNRIILGILKMLRRILGEHIEVQFNQAPSLGTVHVDKGQIEQVLLNLCVNARDAMPEGGTIAIETRNVTLNAEFCRDNAWAEQGTYAMFSVTDTGHGMDAETLAQVFEPFFTTKDVGQGTGLGLATVYGIVSQHSGLIHATSEIDEGTTFEVYLPVVERPVDTKENSSSTPKVGGKETILVAEDEKGVRDLVTLLLRMAGYTVLTACDGEEAVRMYEQHSHAIDLTLLDVMMPKLSGREAMELIQSKYPRARFLFSSGYSENALSSNFALTQGLPLIAKPYSKIKLLEAVRQVLDAR